MPIDSRKLLEAVTTLANERNVRVAVRQSGKGAAICGACSFVGGLLLGPAGLAIGGATGGALAYKMSKGSFRPLGDVIANDLSDTQKKRLIQLVTEAIQDIHPTDLVLMLPLILNDASIQKAVLRTAVNFVSNELHMQIID